MVICQDFETFPPKAFMMQITDALTKMYCFLWEKKKHAQQSDVDVERYFHILQQEFIPYVLAKAREYGFVEL